jgi:Protein of unknown function (DUF1353)
MKGSSSSKYRAFGPQSSHLVATFLAAVLALGGTFALAKDDQPFGYFPNHPQLDWSDDGRTMSLLREFVYIDQTKMNWKSPQGSVVDGASIPRILWSMVGGPYEGKYRNASIVHDTECVAKTHKWQAVHRMFYNASRAGGVGWIKANLMYAGVYYFGPHWVVAAPISDAPAVTVSAKQAWDYLTRLLVILRRDYAKKTLTLESIERLSYEDVVRQVPDNDPDLKFVRDRLAERQDISSSTARGPEFVERVKKVDDELYYDYRESPPTGPIV